MKKNNKPKHKYPHRINGIIRVPEVRVIDSEGKQLGVMSTKKALSLAQNLELDLVEIAPNAKPPVCKILDYSKFLYQQNKKAVKNKEKAPHQIKMTPNIAVHDYQTKLKHIAKFIDKGDKVKVTIVFSRKTIQHPELGFDLIDNILDDTVEFASYDKEPKRIGNNISVLLLPKKK